VIDETSSCLNIKAHTHGYLVQGEPPPVYASYNADQITIAVDMTTLDFNEIF
jgi:hypothetical protein